MTDHLSGDQRTDDDGARGLSAAAGLAFASLFRVLKLVRPVRPIHPNGTGLTGRLVRTGSAGGASGLDWLDAPVQRVTGWDVPYPSPVLEDEYLPSIDRILEAVQKTLEYRRG